MMLSLGIIVSLISAVVATLVVVGVVALMIVRIVKREHEWNRDGI